MRKLVFYATILSMAILSSCDKKEEQVTPNEGSSYANLKVGNYWVYNNYSMINGNRRDWANDTVRVTKDTVIDGHTYFVLEGETGFNRVARNGYLRYSNGNMLTINDNIIFSDSDFDKVLYTNVDIDEDHGNGKRMFTDYKMISDEDRLTVPAGVFETISLRGFTTNEIKDTKYSCAKTFYGKGIGKVKQVWCYATDPDNAHIIKELVDYHIEQ